MALSEKQQQARAIVAQWLALGKPFNPPHDGKKPAIHAEHVYGWLGAAVLDLGLSRPDGAGAYHVDDRLRREASETGWGQTLHDLYTSDRPEVPGWRIVAGRGIRPPWWSVNRHERATEGLVGMARQLSWVQASIEAVPGLSSAWPASGAPPVAEGHWLEVLRRDVLHPAQYAALRAALGLPVEEPQEPPIDPPPPTDPDPPTDPGTPPVPEGLREKLETSLNAAIQAWRLATSAQEAAEKATVAAEFAMERADSALAALEGT